MYYKRQDYSSSLAPIPSMGILKNIHSEWILNFIKCLTVIYYDDSDFSINVYSTLKKTWNIPTFLE